jgi:CheY-like chemotaxis protein
MQDRTRELIEVLKKIPLFHGLSPTQIRLILGQCTAKSIDPGTKVCVRGKPSDEMYVLLAGKLAIIADNSFRVATIKPVTTVGEMGAITGQPRSATVEAISPSQILIIQKAKLDIILRGQRELKSRIFENVIHMLSEKLVQDNVRMRDFLSAKARFAENGSRLERRLNIALDLLAEKGMPREDAEAEIETRANEPRILVVDDEPVARKLLAKGLDQYTVYEAADGVQALEVIKAESPDLVVTDIQMPELDGIGLLKQLRTKHPKLPVLAVTGYMEEEELKAHAFDGYLMKPVSVEDLRELVKSTLDGKGVSQEK